MKGIVKFTFISFFFISHVISAQTDFFGISSITLDEQVYQLKWSNVQQTRIIEEYLLPQESITRYNTKLILEIQAGETFEDIVKAKLAELANEKQEGRVLDYKKVESDNSDEIIIEFTVGVVRETEIHNIEWNVFRYKPNTVGVLLFAMSKRAYEKNNVSQFMEEINKNHANWINSIMNYKLPSSLD